MLAAFGATLVPIMVCESVPTMPPSSVAVNVTMKVPSSFGVKLNEAPEPVAYALPSLVTFHP